MDVWGLNIIRRLSKKYPIKTRILIAAVFITLGFIVTPNDRTLGHTFYSEVQYVLKELFFISGGALLGSTANVLYYERKDRKSHERNERNRQRYG